MNFITDALETIDFGSTFLIQHVTIKCQKCKNSLSFLIHSASISCRYESDVFLLFNIFLPFSSSGKDHLTSSTPVVTKHANLPVSTCEPLQFESDVSLEDTADPKSQSELSPMERALFSDESDGDGGVPGKILKHKRFSMENFVKGNTKSKKRKVHGDKGKITSRDVSSYFYNTTVETSSLNLTAVLLMMTRPIRIY